MSLPDFKFGKDQSEYYRFDPESYALEHAQKKASGTTKETIAALKLFSTAISKHDISLDSPKLSLDKLQKLEQFSHALEHHIETSIRKKHSLFGGIIVAFQKAFGSLSSLHKLEHSFSQLQEKKIQQQKEAVLAACANFSDSTLNDFDGLRIQLRKVDPRLRKTDWYKHAASLLRNEFAKLLSVTPDEKTLEKLIDRCGQLDDVRITAELTKRDVVKMAYFIECTLPAMQSRVEPLFKRQTKQALSEIPTYDIPRSVVYDVERGDVYILLKRKACILDASGTNKKVTAALRVPLLHAKAVSTLVAQAVTKDSVQEMGLKEVQKEHAIYRELQGSIGIWELHFCTDYTTVKKKDLTEEKISKVSSFAPMASSNIENAILKPRELIDVTFELAQGLHAMHEKGYVHGDLKGDNALMRRNGAIVAGWIDFGFTFKAGVESPTFIFNDGYYGSIIYTSPELFGVKKFSGDFFKTDVFAFGYMLFRKHVKVPSWEKLILSYYDNGNYRPVGQAAQKKMKNLLANEIEEPLKQLLRIQKIRPLAQDEAFRLVIYKMMRQEPTERIDMKTAVEELRQLKALTVTP